MIQQARPGFTLVEMKIALVIMVILAVVVSIYYVSVRDKARIARAKLFEQNLVKALEISKVPNATLLGEWAFDGGNYDDTSGNFTPSNTQIYGSPTFSNDCQSGKCLQLASGDEVRLNCFAPACHQPDVQFDEVTMMAWVKSGALSDSLGGFGVNMGNVVGMFFTETPSFASVICGQFGCISRAMSASFKIDIWHHFVVMYNNNNLAAYIDGEQVYRQSLNQNLREDIILIQFGNNSDAWSGVIDSVRVYNSVPDEYI